MKISIEYFTGDLYQLGQEIGASFGDVFLSKKPSPTELAIPRTYLPYLRGLSESTGIPITKLLSIASVPYGRDVGDIKCLKGHTLYAHYKLTSEDLVLFHYGELDGMDFCLFTLAPGLPGNLGGMNRGGLAYAQYLSARTAMTERYPLSMLQADVTTWTTAARSEKLVVAGPCPIPGIWLQAEHVDVKLRTPETYAEALFDKHNSDNDVMFLYECQKRLVTITRGEGQSKTFNILAGET